MSTDPTTQLVRQLESDDPQARAEAILLLAETAEVEQIPRIRELYDDDTQPKIVRDAARDALGIFKAVQEALDADIDVAVPTLDEARAMKGPPIPAALLRRVLIGLVGVLAVVWIVNIVLLVVGSGGGGGESDSLLGRLQTRHTQVAADAAIQTASWEALAADGALDCAVAEAAPTSIDSTDLKTLEITEAEQPNLYRANLALIEAIDRLALVAGDWLVSCRTGQAIGTADDHLESLALVDAALAQAQTALEAAQTVGEGAPPPSEAAPQEAFTAAPTGELPPTEAGVTTAPPTPLAPPTLTPLPELDYPRYIRGMQERIDFIIGPRGTAVLLAQYWQDVLSQGQSFGCRQPLSDDYLIPYTSITPEIAARDSRLQAIQEMINNGVELVQQSLASFQQGCNAGSFDAYLPAGPEQVSQGTAFLEQAQSLLTALQAEVSGS